MKWNLHLLALLLIFRIDAARSADAPIGLMAVPSIAAMQALGPASSQNPFVYVAGCAEANDGCQGIFAWAGSSTARADFGTVFTADRVSTGRWVRQYSGPINAKWFNAKGNGTADDTRALKAWLAALGSGYFESEIVGPRAGFLPAGKYRITEGLAIPGLATVEGVAYQSVIQPGKGVNIAVSQAAGSTLDSIVIDGVNGDSGKIGLQVATTTVINNGVTRNVVVARFTGPGAVGVDIQGAVTWSFQDVYATDNYDGVKLSTLISSNLTFTNLISKSNDRYGLWLRSGQAIKFYGPLFELNGAEGIFMDPESPRSINGVTFDHAYLEVNQQNLPSGPRRHSAFQIVAAGNRVVFRDGVSYDEGVQARALRIVGGRDFVIDHLSVTALPGEIEISNAATGTVVNWPADSSGDSQTTIRRGVR